MIDETLSQYQQGKREWHQFIMGVLPQLKSPTTDHVGIYCEGGYVNQTIHGSA